MTRRAEGSSGLRKFVPTRRSEKPTKAPPTADDLNARRFNSQMGGFLGGLAGVSVFVGAIMAKDPQMIAAGAALVPGAAAAGSASLYGITRLGEAVGRIAHPEFYPRVRPLTPTEKQQWEQYEEASKK